jgi:hypothetical protein
LLGRDLQKDDSNHFVNLLLEEFAAKRSAERSEHEGL